MFYEKEVILYEPDDLLRMLIEIWLFRTPFKVLRNVANQDEFEASLGTNLFKVGICSAELENESISSILNTASNFNVALLFIEGNPNRFIRELQERHQAVAILKSPFNQKDLLNTLLSLTTQESILKNIN